MTLRRLSVVDTGWPGHVRELVPALEQAGYHRYWTTEHYTPSQSSSPALLAAVAAGMTTRMRIGTAGVLLNLEPPLRVLNDFQLLELLYPGRIDMGVAGADGGRIVTDAMRASPTADGYAERLRELAKLQRLTSWHNGDPRVEAIGPRPASPTPLWVCGTSVTSAELAGRVGAAYAFHDHLSPTGTDGPRVLAAYRESFRPCMFRSEPEVVVACTGAVAEAEPVARAMLDARGMEHASFVGSAPTVRSQLEELASRYGVDELAVYLVADELGEKIEGYQSIAPTG